MDAAVRVSDLPALPLDAWEDSKNTLHLYLQIVGKIRLALFPKTNHWWHVPLYVSSRGLTTRPIPYGDRMFEIQFDLIDHRLNVVCSDGRTEGFELNALSVADFYARLMGTLEREDIVVKIKAEPYDVPFSSTPFAEDREHAAYDKDWVSKYWQALVFVDSVFEAFRGRFVGKSTPVHLFWHHADLALTRFSGKAAPPLTGGSAADREAYSHEVISFGFWAGDGVTREPAFYAYAYPEPEGLQEEALSPPQAKWRTDYGYTMGFLTYEDMRQAADPEAYLLEFLESAYRVFARRAGWDVEQFALRPL